MFSVSGTEHCTFQNVPKITVDSDSVIPQEKRNYNEEDCQENPKLPYN